ncbi:uncharacterized protein LOC132554984 [Ylistrum balloti]|uniref:uncharacterized protein LOC132554984 n=1 Tax=Ylistrum balloti TaxID=509963 RepID=UPI002905CE92|nr:uncharacterized protein LOC132554984 [Ylistrum balloti]
MKKWLWIFTVFSLSVEYLTEADGVCGGCFKAPDFTSSYILMEAQTDQSEEIVEHGLNEVPIKVDVQVKPINTSDYVFPGLGSAQRDDDEPGTYGGVVYKYNDISVVLYVPNRNDDSSSGTIIYTGNNTWTGSFIMTENRAEVRAKVWTNCSFPAPQFDSDWFPISVNNGSRSFKEIPHGLGTYPEYVSVQIKDKNSNWYSDGIGSAMNIQSLNQQSAWGGVIYGFNDSHVRIWVPGFDSGSLFSTADGWGRGSKEYWNEGFVRVRVWSHFNGDLVYYKASQLSNTKRKRSLLQPSQKKGNLLDIDTGMIYLTVKANDGANDGFSFPGMGAVQNSDPLQSFGGIVYAYGPRIIYPWQHVHHSNQYLIYINQNWGGGKMTQKSNNGSMVVRFWEPYSGSCPTSPISHAVTIHLDGGNPTTLSRPATQPSMNPHTTIGNTTVLSQANTSKASQGMSGTVLGIIIGACLLVVVGVATGVLCVIFKKKKAKIGEKNATDG